MRNGAVTPSILLLLAQLSCVSPEAESGKTDFKLRALHAAVHFFELSEGRLPRDLAEICAVEASWCRLMLADEWIRDEWGTPVRFIEVPEGVVLTSAGADRQFETLDDLVLESEMDRRRATRMAGCYLFSERALRFGGDTLRLGDAITIHGGYVIEAPVTIDSDSAFIAYWYPVGTDSLVAHWIRFHRGISMKGRLTGDGLEARVGRRTISAPRIDC